MVELVDTPDLGSGAFGCESSSLSFRTILTLYSIQKNRQYIGKILLNHAGVVELVDTPDLGSGASGCESSSLSFRTICSDVSQV